MNETTPNGQESVAGGLTALLSWQTIRKGLDWSCGSSGCAHHSESLMSEAFLVTLTLAASTWGGWVFSRFYFTDGTSQASRIQHTGARRLFCVVFGACCNTIILVLFELLGVLTFSFRLAALKTHITLLVLFMLCAIPCYQIHGLLRNRLPPRSAALGTLIAQLALMHLLLHVLPPWPGVAEPASAGLFSLRVAILRTGVLGVCVIAVLAGFGTVDFPFRVLRAFVVPVNPYEVQVLQTQLQQVRDQIADRTQQLEYLENKARAADISQAKGDRSWLSSFAASFTANSAESERIAALRMSIEGLAVMEATLAVDVAELVAERQRELAASTLLGRLANCAGYGLAAYCVFKMLACLKSVLLGDDFTTDPVSRVLGFALRLFSGGSLQLDKKAASHYITLLFVGFVSFNSLRAFLKHIRRAASSAVSVIGGSLAAPASVASAADAAMLGLGALLCAYTVSSVMLLRAQLPVAHRELVTVALGYDAKALDSEFDAVHRWFNGMQLVSMLATLGLCYWQFKNKKANVMDVASVMV